MRTWVFAGLLLAAPSARAVAEPEAVPSSRLELPVLGSFDWVRWAQKEVLSHAPASSEARSLSLPVERPAARPAAYPAAYGPSAFTGLMNRFDFKPTFGLKGLNHPHYGASLDAKVSRQAGVFAGDHEDPLANLREMKFGFYEGPLRVEASKSIQTQTQLQTTSLGTQLNLFRASVWSRYSPEDKSFGFGVSHPIAEGVSWNTQLSQNPLERRIMVGVNSTPSAVWRAFHGAVH